MTTNYPVQIDDTISLPTVSDNFSIVRAASVNLLRDAIIAIEAELGVKPSGTYGTVRARLDAITASLGFITSIEQSGVALGGGPFNTLNFSGTGVSITNGAAGVANIAITGGGGGGGATGQVITTANWFIDPVSGNDSNTGASGHPLKTFAQLLKLWGLGATLQPTGGTLTITFLNSQPNRLDPVSFRDLIVASDCSVQVVANSRTTVSSSTFTAVTTINHSTNTPWKVSDTTVSTWTPEDRIRITSGANSGNVFWVAKDLGSHQARVSAPVNPATFLNSPVLGAVASSNPYVIETLMQIYVDEVIPHVSISNALTIYPIITFIDFEINDPASFGMFVDGESDVVFQGCLINSDIYVNGQSTDLGTIFIDCCFGAGTSQFAESAMTMWAGLIHNNIEVSTANRFSGQVFLDADVLLQGSTLTPLGLLRIGTTGVFDAPGMGVSSILGVYIGNNLLADHALYGSGNAQYGVDMPSNSWLFYQTNIPTITGSSGDFILAGATSARAWNETAGSYTASISNTWTHLGTSIGGGGFGGNAHVLDANCHISPSTGTGGGGGPGGGSPAGTTNDIQLNGGSGSFAADTGNFTYDPTLHTLLGGSGCTNAGASNAIAFGGSCSIGAGGSSGVALGSSCQANGQVSVAIGDICIANGTASFCSGVFTQSFRYGERAHFSGSSGDATAEDSHLAGFYGVGTAAAVNLADAVSTELTLEDGKVYSMRARVMASQTSPSIARAHEIHELLLYAHSGTLHIVDDDVISNPSVNFASQGYTLTISAPSGLVLRFNCNPSTNTVKFFAVCEWSALPDT